MKVLLHYEDNESNELWKSLKITLPKSWKTGPTEKLLGQFVESYNAIDTLGGGPNPLDKQTMHLAIRSSSDSTSSTTQLVPLASDAIVLDVIPDRADVYVLHGAPQTLQEIQALQQQELEEKKKHTLDTVQCTRFGCKHRFPKGGPYPSPCKYHKSPPVFHETAKFWSCCPTKKAYDWDDFQNIPGCCEAPTCTEIKDDTNKQQFLGGTDLREQAGEAVKLKSIDDFNKSQQAGGTEAAPILDRLQTVLFQMGIEKELYNQVIDGMKKQLMEKENITEESAPELLEAIKTELSKKLKATFQTIATDQLRIQ